MRMQVGISRSVDAQPCTQLEGPVNYSILSGRVSVRQEPSIDLWMKQTAGTCGGIMQANQGTLCMARVAHVSVVSLAPHPPRGQRVEGALCKPRYRLISSIDEAYDLY